MQKLWLALILTGSIGCSSDELATDTIEQAIERAGTKAGNKGYESAETAIEMADLLRQLPKPT